MDHHSPLLTIVIPAYNEERRLPTTLPRVVAFAEAQDYPVEVLVVDNASTDHTPEIARQIAAEHPIISPLYQPIRGKGAAVRKGMLEGRGEYLFICDADLAMPIEEVSKFLPPILSNYDVAIASREVAGAVRHNEPWYRHLMGRVFNALVRLLAVPGIQDTQCGFKCLHREAARDIFTTQIVDGWAFDVEILYIARRRGGRQSLRRARHHLSSGQGLSRRSVAHTGRAIPQVRLWLAFGCAARVARAGGPAQFQGMLAGILGIPRMLHQRRAVQHRRTVDRAHLDGILARVD